MILFETLFLIFSELISDFFNFRKISLNLDLMIQAKYRDNLIFILAYSLCTSHPFSNVLMTVNCCLNRK